MIFWLLVAAAALAAALAMALPLLRRPVSASSESVRGLAVYKDQLAEIARDRASGLMSDAEAAAARTEIERRILKSAEAPSASPTADAGARMLLAGLVIGAIPAGALALYLALGSPNAPATLPAVAIDDSLSPDALAEFAQTLLAQNRAADAARALTRAAAKAPQRADLRSQLGEALVAADNGQVGEAARAAFRETLAFDARDPRARFYLGLARAQDGDAAGAVDDWLALEAEAAPDAPWLALLAERLQAAAAEAGIDLTARRGARPARGPSAADMAAAEKMSPAERQQMVRGMVDGLAQRLEENPGDIEGWRRLARAREVLGDQPGVIEALRRATLAAPERVDLLVDYGRALHPPGTAAETIAPEFIVLMRRVLALDPNNAEALFFVGEAEARAGNPTEARVHWERLLARIDPKEPLHRMIGERLKTLAP